jgi:DNA-binding NarL/FixJ family response regulator
VGAAPRTVLIVDDYAAIRVLRRIAVEEASFAVCGEAQEGGEAVRLAHETEARPRDDGSDDAGHGRRGGARLITESPGISVLVISDVDSSDRIGAAIEAGACWHVAKRDVVRELPLALAALLR